MVARPQAVVTGPMGAEGGQQQQKEETSVERVSGTKRNLRSWRMTNKKETAQAKKD